MFVCNLHARQESKSCAATSVHSSHFFPSQVEWQIFHACGVRKKRKVNFYLCMHLHIYFKRKKYRPSSNTGFGCSCPDVSGQNLSTIVGAWRLTAIGASIKTQKVSITLQTDGNCIFPENSMNTFTKLDRGE